MEASVENGSNSTATHANPTRSLGFSDFRRLLPESNDTNNSDSSISTSKPREVNADATTLICLLQSIGFHLKKFDRVTSASEVKKNNELVRVTIECESSGMRADLQYRNPQCTCPRENTNASLWNISGTGKFLSQSSTSLVGDEKFIETGSNLLPPLDKDAVSVLGDVLAQLIFLVNTYGKPGQQDGDYGDEDGGRAAGEPSLGLTSHLDASFQAQQSFQESLLSSSMIRCHTQPEICARDQIGRRFSLNYPMPRILTTQPTEERDGRLLMRQSTFELKDDPNGEPRASPPKMSSSPVTVCSSLSQVSSASDEGGPEAFGLETLLNKASFYLEKARRMYCTKYINDECSPIQFSNSPRDDVFLKPRQLSRSSSQRASPATVRKKSTSPSAKKLEPNPGIRRSIGGSYSSLRKPSLSSIKSGVSPATLSRINQNTTPKLPPRTRSIGTPSPTLRAALESVKKRASLAAAKSAIPSARIMTKPSAGSGSRILTLGNKSISSRYAAPPISASTSLIGKSEGSKKNTSFSSSSSFGLDRSRLKKNISPAGGENNFKNSIRTPVKDPGKKSLNSSVTTGLKK